MLQMWHVLGAKTGHHNRPSRCVAGRVRRVDSAETVTEAVRQLQSLGYDRDFEFAATGINCRACDHQHMPERLEVTHTYRFEGATNPSDEEIVLGVRCPHCEALGVIVSAYGPAAEPELFDLLVRLMR
jgi:hypothetical protein